MLSGFKLRPISSAVMVLMAIYLFWMSWAVHTTTTLAKGPLQLLTYGEWTWIFFVAGLATFIRLFTFPWVLADTVLHLIAALTFVAWAITFDMGPISTGQPTYTLLAIVAIIAPYLNTAGHLLQKKGFYKK